jgi:hypothetical protein
MNTIQVAAICISPFMLAFGVWWLVNSYREDKAEVQTCEDPFSERS